MKFLVRQTYTTASLVAMVPAAIWSVSWYGAGGMVHIIGRFPYVYLFICQLMVVPRYVAAAWLTVWLSQRFKQFNCTAGYIGFVALGVVFDIWMTFAFAQAIAQPPAGNHALLIPLLALVYGLVILMVGALVGGFGWPYLKPRLKRAG